MIETQTRKYVRTVKARGSRKARGGRKQSCVVIQACDETEADALRREKVKDRGIREVTLIPRLPALNRDAASSADLKFLSSFKITPIPQTYLPRPYQLDAWCALQNGVKRVLLVWHRRAGKDLMLLNRTIVAAHERIGIYWHVFPTAKQGRKIIWDGVTKDGRPFLDYWPQALIAQRHETDMKLKLKNGSVWQVVGSDNYNEALIGGNPAGIVLSEYALQNPSCWNYLRPILAENGGWAAFPFTPRGRNHASDLFEMARDNPDWFCERLGVRDTSVISAETIEDERRAGMPDELIDQEFHCSFDAALVGAYYGKHMAAALDDGRIASVPYEPMLPVETWWDLGVDDATAIWFVQRMGGEIRLISYYEASGQGLDHYAAVLLSRGYVYARHVLPHDIRVREMGSGARSRLETLKSLLGAVNVNDEPTAQYVIAPAQHAADRINAARAILPRCWFDAKACAAGLEALRQYQRKWDDNRKTFLDAPLHDWTSHAADAFSYGAITLTDTPAFASPTRAISDYDVLGGIPCGEHASSRTRELVDYDPLAWSPE